MTSEKAVLIAISGAVYQMHAEDRAKVEALATQFREIVAANPDHGMIALSLVGAELAAREAAI